MTGFRTDFTSSVWNFCRSSSRNVPSRDEGGETVIFAGYRTRIWTVKNWRASRALLTYSFRFVLFPRRAITTSLRKQPSFFASGLVFPPGETSLCGEEGGETAAVFAGYFSTTSVNGNLLQTLPVFSQRFFKWKAKILLTIISPFRKL